MATVKSTSREDFAKGGIFEYQIDDAVATLDASEVVAAIPEWASSALHFALKTAARNATAGLMSKPEDVAEAIKRVSARIGAWSAGKWQAASERSGEPRESLLARAVAEAMYGGDVATAVEDISAAIAAAYEQAGVDPDSEDKDEKAKVRKIAKDLRDQLRDSAEVLPIYSRMQKEEIDKRANAKSTGGETPKPSAGSLLKR